MIVASQLQAARTFLCKDVPLQGRSSAIYGLQDYLSIQGAIKKHVALIGRRRIVPTDGLDSLSLD
jgi:hypothetical protein